MGLTIDEIEGEDALVRYEYEKEGNRYAEVRIETAGSLSVAIERGYAFVPAGSVLPENVVKLTKLEILQAVTRYGSPIKDLVLEHATGTVKLRAKKPKKPKGKLVQLTLDEELFKMVTEYSEMQRIPITVLIRTTLFEVIGERLAAIALRENKRRKASQTWIDDGSKKPVGLMTKEEKVKYGVTSDEPPALTQAQKDAFARANANVGAKEVSE